MQKAVFDTRHVGAAYRGLSAKIRIWFFLGQQFVKGGV